MRNIIIKRFASMLICIVLLVGSFSSILINASAQGYDSDYRKWSQAATSYPKLKYGGCWVVAQAKLIYETGINNSMDFNPDEYYKWQLANNLCRESGYQNDGKNSPIKYAKSLGNTGLTCIEVTEKNCYDRIRENIRNGYFTIAYSKSRGHYFMIDNSDSLSKGEIWIYDSWSSANSVDPRKETYGISKIFTYAYTEPLGISIAKDPKKTLLCQYSSTGKSSVAGSKYAGFVAFEHTGQKVYSSSSLSLAWETGVVRFYDDNFNPNGNLQINSNNIGAYKGINTKNIIYFMRHGDVILFYGNKSLSGKYYIVGKVHYSDGSSLKNITKIDSLRLSNPNSSSYKIEKDYTYNAFKNKSIKAPDGGLGCYLKKDNRSFGSLPYSTGKIGEYIARYDVVLRTGPGYNYPEATGSIFTNSVDEGSILSDDIISTASVQSNSTMVSTNSVASIIKKNEVIGITKIQNGWGYTTYKGISGWLNLRYCSYQGTLITKPQPPVVKLLTSPDIPATGTITVSWDSVYDAKYYKAVLFNSAGAEVKSYGNLYGTSATFTPQDEGVYTVKVYAQNSMYTSDPGVLAQAITVHGKSKVTYYDDDGKTVLGTQEVSYTNSSTAPIAPEKEGYSFYGWVDINDNSGEAENTKTVSLENIKAEKSVKAKYTKNKYQVMFLDNKGNQIGSTQSVPYMESAIPPEPPALDGYLFAGWSSDDYKNVYRLNKSDIIKIYPVYVWENKEIPVTCTITEASRQKDGYYVIFDVENHVADTTRGRAVVCLKTKSDKLVYTTESAAFSILGNTKKSAMEVFVPCESAATKAEVIILDSFEKSIPISKSVSSSIDQSNMWSQWKFYDEENGKEVEPSFDSDTEYEKRAVYRYQIKEKATNNTNTKAGYILYGDKTAHPGSWSGWSDSIIDSFNYPDRTRRVETRLADVYSTKTKYDYFHYYKSSGSTHWSPIRYNGYGADPHRISLDYGLSWKGNSSVSGWSHYGTYWCSCGGSNFWYPNGTHSESYVSGQKTQYRYYDTTYTYYFYRWSDWSDWQATPVIANDDRNVQVKHQYRTKSISAAIEDDSGENKTVSGTLDPSLAGKYINLYVMKYNENSDWTNEYVGQSIINSDGSYNFFFKLREELSVKTGDMTAYIGIQGSAEMQAVQVFEAPKAIHKVVYEYEKEVIKNGKTETETVALTQYVQDGDSATVPDDIPEKTNYIFAGWNNTCTNVKSDMVVRPIFVEKECVVQYIDPRVPENCKIQVCKAGDLFETPEISESADESENKCESGHFVGWDTIEQNIGDEKNPIIIEGAKTVSDNVVVMAEYETKTFDVNFVGVDGELLDSQTIEYDGYVKAPELPEKDGVNFLEWDVDEEKLSNVTDSITVNAVYYFDETTETPKINLASGAYDGTQTVTISCDTPNAVIWYTLDGSNPSENPDAIEYTEPITISESTVLNCYAGSINANDSDVAQEMYVIDGKGKIVTIHNTVDDDLTNRVMVNTLSEITDESLKYDGYNFEGLYYDDAFTLAVKDNDNDSCVVDVYAKYSICKYNVSFKNNDGDVIKTETVEYGASATPPNMSDMGELVFIGWDNDYSYISDDIELTPIYKNKSEIVTVNLDRSNYTLEEGFSFKLNATVTPENKSDLEVIWISKDDSIASVLDDGTVTANNPGETIIYAVTEDDSAVAECKITVNKNVNNSLILKESAKIGIDSEGNLRGIPLDNNTVSFISSQFRNTASSLRFVSSNGDVLLKNSKVGTGSTIYLMNGEKILDTIKVVVTGDVNGDGKVNNADVAKIARFVVKKEEPDYYQSIAADVNGNGSVNNRDAAYLMRYLVGKETL